MSLFDYTLFCYTFKIFSTYFTFPLGTNKVFLILYPRRPFSIFTGTLVITLQLQEPIMSRVSLGCSHSRIPFFLLDILGTEKSRVLISRTLQHKEGLITAKPSEAEVDREMGNWTWAGEQGLQEEIWISFS